MPRVKVLDYASTTALDLIGGDWDYVICTYQYVQSRYSNFSEYRAAYEDLAEPTTTAADASSVFEAHPAWRRQRHHAPLHTSVYKDLDKLFTLILDESQSAKTLATSTYAAMVNLPAKYGFLVTGTTLVNRWNDVYSAISLFTGYSFRSLQTFKVAFASQPLNRRLAEPSVTKQNRLIKFLQAVVIARPSILLGLEEVEYHPIDFMLLDKSVVKIVTYLLKMFFDAIRVRGVEAHDPSGDNSRRSLAIYYATIAQQLAANKDMLLDRENSYIAEL